MCRVSCLYMPLVSLSLVFLSPLSIANKFYLWKIFAGVLMGHGGTLMAGSTTGNLRSWSTIGLNEMRLPGEPSR